MNTRRYFIKNSALALAGMGLVPPFLLRAAAAVGADRKRRILVAIFQRGAADGLNMVVPHGDKSYYALRPSIAIPRPGPDTEATVSDLDEFFGLHPALRPLLPLWERREMAIIQAVGSPHSTRSHFDAQDFMETATPGLRSTRDGWLNRHLQASPQPQATPFRAVALGGGLPRSLSGRAPAVAMTSLGEFDVRAGRASTVVKEQLGEMYDGESDVLGRTGREMLEAVEFLRKSDPRGYRPAEGARYPRGRFGDSLRQFAQLIKAGVGLEVACAEIGGWDHHANQGGVNGQLAQRSREFAEGLAAFYVDLGARMEHVLILTMSEFGRTAHQNGNLGTDHGHANAMFVLGGAVRGGRVLGRWPGLEREQLYEGRDLALTTDFRDVFAEVLSRHLGCPDAKGVFPGFAAAAQRYLGFLA